MDQLIEDIKIITLFALTFFALFLFTYRKGNHRVNIFLGLIYLYQALESLNSTFYRFFDFWSTQYPWVFYSTEATFFLWGPTIYFFFKMAVDPDFRFTKKHVWHLVPAIVHLAFLTMKFHWHTNAEKTALLETGVMSPTEDFVIHSLKNAVVVGYLILSTVEIRAKIHGRKSMRWLLFFLTAFYIVECIQILHFYDLFTRSYNTQIYNTTSIIWCFIAISTMYMVFKNPLILVSSDTAALSALTQSSPNRKEIDRTVDAIKGQFIRERMYLNPDLSLQAVADELGISYKLVSQAINEHFDMNFSDFVNFYRIEEAKNKLSNPEYAPMTVIEIAYEVGFNSKATFNRAFSKFTNLSPTQFRKAQQ